LTLITLAQIQHAAKKRFATVQPGRGLSGLIDKRLAGGEGK